MTDLQIANMLADYHKECELAETLTEKADVQLKHARLIREALLQPPVRGSLPSPEDVKRWYQLLIGKGEEAMYDDIR